MVETNEDGSTENRFETIEKQVERLGQVAGWAPGGYVNVCGSCDTHFIGDKRATMCLPCAVEAVKLRAREDGLTYGYDDGYENGHSDGVCEAMEDY